MATAICLIGFGLALITDAIDPRYMPGDVNRLRRLMYTGGVVGIVSVLGLYVVTRTAGIPFGPGSGSVESLGSIDLVAKAADLSATAGLVMLLLKTRTHLGHARLGLRVSDRTLQVGSASRRRAREDSKSLRVGRPYTTYRYPDTSKGDTQ